MSVTQADSDPPGRVHLKKSARRAFPTGFFCLHCTARWLNIRAAADGRCDELDEDEQ
jgi:hypothetical protein